MKTIDFNKDVQAVGDYVTVEIIENNDSMLLGGIYAPSTYASNERVAFAKVVAVGNNAQEKTGLKPDDHVYIDRLATFYHTKPIAVLKYDSVICKADKDTRDIHPLKNMLFIKPIIEKNRMDNGIYITEMSGYGNQIGEVIEENFDDEHKYLYNDIPLGCKVFMTKGADIFYVNGTNEIHIYKPEMLVGIFEL